MSIGYLYVLINPTMPGLAKVGKTTRDPSTRVAELSAATGIASPFILAYQQLVPDCDAAEASVHAELARGGFRVASNREFFSAPLHEIVELITKVARLISDTAEDMPTSTSTGSVSTRDLVKELIELGDTFREGKGVLVNSAKAVEFYEQAAKLQSDIACVMAGLLHQYGGKGLRPNPEEAVRYFSQAIALGSWHCHESLAEVFQGEGQIATASDCRVKLFEQANEMLATDRSQTIEIMGEAGATYFYSVACSKYKHTVPNHLISPFSQSIAAVLKTKAASEPATLPWHLKGKFNAALRLLQDCQPTLPPRSEA